MSSRPLDTSPAEWATYYAVLDRMDGAARLHAALQLSDTVRELRLAGIRDRHPELSEREVVARLVAEDYSYVERWVEELGLRTEFERARASLTDEGPRHDS